MKNQKVPTGVGMIVIIIVAVTVGMFAWKYEKLNKQNEIQLSNLDNKEESINENSQIQNNKPPAEEISLIELKTDPESVAKEWKKCREMPLSERNYYLDWVIHVTKVDPLSNNVPHPWYRRIQGYVANNPEFLVTGEYYPKDNFLSNVKAGDDIEIIGKCGGPTTEYPIWNPHIVPKEEDYKFNRFSGITKQQLFFDDNMDNWNVFQNKDYRFEFKYPTIYYTTDSTQNNRQGFGFKGIQIYKDFGVILTDETYDKPTLVSNESCKGQEILFPRDKDIMSKTSINGIEAYFYDHYHCVNLVPVSKSRTYYFPTDDGKTRALTFSQWNLEKNQFGPVDINYQNRILSSVKLTN